jgi:hypothetical protein
MRAYAPSIAQGEGRSLGEWRIGVFSLRPLTIHQEPQKIIHQYKLIVNRIYISDVRVSSLLGAKGLSSEKPSI